MDIVLIMWQVMHLECTTDSQWRYLRLVPRHLLEILHKILICYGVDRWQNIPMHVSLTWRCGKGAFISVAVFEVYCVHQVPELYFWCGCVAIDIVPAEAFKEIVDDFPTCVSVLVCRGGQPQPIWARMGSYGAIWAHMGPYGPIWSHMVPYGPLWSPMVPYGLICSPYGRVRPHMGHMGPYGAIWCHMVPYGPHMGPIWSHRDPYGSHMGPISIPLCTFRAKK